MYVYLLLVCVSIPCICLYVHVFVCICDYIYVNDCICFAHILPISLPHFLFVQSGLMPLATKNYKDFPLTRTNSDKPSPRIESFHMAVTFLRCFNAAVHDLENNIVMNWWKRDNRFVRGLRKVPQYTDLFWHLFFKVAGYLGEMKTSILDANTATQIDDLRARRVKVYVRNEDNEVVLK